MTKTTKGFDRKGRSITMTVPTEERATLKSYTVKFQDSHKTVQLAGAELAKLVEAAPYLAELRLKVEHARQFLAQDEAELAKFWDKLTGGAADSSDLTAQARAIALNDMIGRNERGEAMPEHRTTKAIG